MADNPLEIPQTLRDVSEQNLKQAPAEYASYGGKKESRAIGNCGFKLRVLGISPKKP